MTACKKEPCHEPSIDPPAKPTRPYEEILASFNGNEVKIRIPKSTYKLPKLTPSQQKLHQNCTCDDEAGSICSETCGEAAYPDGSPANKLNFQIPDNLTDVLNQRTRMNSEIVYCKKEAHDTMCNICNVTPEDAPKGVQAQKVLYPDKDVFLLKIGKQTDEPNRTGNIEVELVTPRAPPKPRPLAHHCRLIQCDEEDIPCCLPCRVCRPAQPKKRRRRNCY